MILNYVVLILFGISFLTTVALGYAASEMDRSNANYQKIRITYLVMNGVMTLLACCFMIFIFYTLSTMEEIYASTPRILVR